MQELSKICGQDQAALCARKMKKVGDGYDYEAFINGVFSGN